MPIDTLKAAHRLQEDELFSPEQAERIAEILSDLDVASATKEDLDALGDRLTSRFDHLGDRIDEVEERLSDRIDETNGRIDRLNEKMVTKEELETVKSELSQQIEENQSETIRTAVGAVAAVGAVLAVEIPLAFYLDNPCVSRKQRSVRSPRRYSNFSWNSPPRSK